MRHKEENRTTNGHGRIKFRYMEFDMDGGTDALAEGLKSLATAISRGAPIPQPSRTLSAPKPAPTSTLVESPQEELQFPAEEADSLRATEEIDSVSSVSNEVMERPRVRRAPRTPNVLNNIDITAGQLSLAEFVKQKNPQSVHEKFGVIAAWLKEQHNLPEITGDHIYTCFRLLDWPAPDDVDQRLREIKHGKKWFDKGDGKGGYKINIVGLNAVHRMGNVSQ
jgi:hypothetical protein